MTDEHRPDESDEEHEGERPLFRDKRRIDPVTGEARQSPDAAASDAAAAGQDAGAQAPASGPAPADAEAEAAAAVDDGLSDEDRALLEGEAQRVAAERGELEAQTAAAVDELRRLQAEYVNYRARVERERAADQAATTASVLRTLLPSLDDLDLADKHGDLEGSPLAIVANRLRTSIAALGLEAVGVQGEPFDTAVHEAIAQLPNPGATEMTVADVVQRGYRIGDRLLRPAKVAVFVPSEPPAPGAPE